MAVTYPEGMTDELARELYGEVTVKWSSKPFAYDESRSECREWLERGRPYEGYYDSGFWPQLVNVIRRFDNNDVRVFQYSDGSVIEQET